MKSQAIDIKALTSELRDHARGVQRIQQTKVGVSEKTKSVEPITKKEEILDVPKQAETNEKTSSFLALIDEVNAREYSDLNRYVYVSDDIHDIFQRLKGQTKLRISHLATYLLERFINEHREAIVEIISKKSNKFLDR
jgi:hypothetical protein